MCLSLFLLFPLINILVISFTDISINFLLISAVPKKKENLPVEDSNTVPSPKPIPASAILTFVPDNEVKKIVTRPQADDSTSPTSEKQMVLRDRKPAVQDSPYSRRRSPVVSDLSIISGGSESGKEPIEDNKLDAAERDTEGVLPTSSSVVTEAGVSERKIGNDTPGMISEATNKIITEASQPVCESRKQLEIPATSHLSGKSGSENKIAVLSEPNSESGNKIAGGSESMVTKEDQLSAQSTGMSKDDGPSHKNPDKKSGIEIQPSLSNTQTMEAKIIESENKMSTQASGVGSSGAISKTDVSPSLLVNSDSGKPTVNDGTVSYSGAPGQSKVNATSTSAVDDAVTTVKQEVEGPVFRLGQEGNYSAYVNQFTSNTLALNKHQHMDQRDRRRSVTHKFSLNEFKWHGDACGSKDVILNSLRFSIVGLENSVPTSFMHPSWPVQRSTWVRAVHLSKTPQEFAAALSFLESSIRPICYLSVWNDAVGHIELHRVMLEARQAGTKKKDHKEEEEEPELDHKGFGWYIYMYY